MSIFLFIMALLLALASAVFARSAYCWSGYYESAVSAVHALPSFMAPELEQLADAYEDNAAQCRLLSIFTGVLAVAFAGAGWWML